MACSGDSPKTNEHLKAEFNRDMALVLEKSMRSAGTVPGFTS